MSKVRNIGDCTKCEFNFRFDGDNKHTTGERQVKFVTYVNI